MISTQSYIISLLISVSITSMILNFHVWINLPSLSLIESTNYMSEKAYSNKILEKVLETKVIITL